MGNAQEDQAELVVGQIAGVAQDEIAGDPPGRALELSRAADDFECGGAVGEVLVGGVDEPSVVDRPEPQLVAVPEIDRRGYGEGAAAARLEPCLEQCLDAAVVVDEVGFDAFVPQSRHV